MLNRFLAMKAEERKLIEPEKRPFSISECSDLARAQYWRDNIIGDINKKMQLIQNGLLHSQRTPPMMCFMCRCPR
jgi:pre-mRNA-splicing factor ISY1